MKDTDAGWDRDEGGDPEAEHPRPRVSTIPASSSALIWQDVDGQWGARIHYADVWPVTRYPTAEDAIEARDKMRDDYRAFFGETTPAPTTIERTEHGVKLTAEAPHQNPSAVEAARLAVSRACLENRAELEQAAASVEGIREIIDALDDWHTASIEVMQTADGITPAEIGGLAVL